MSKTTTRQMVLAAVAACEEKKAENIRVLELDPADSAFTDFFLICSGANSRQNQAIAQEIELRLKREFGAYANSVEGYRQGEWILVDYVDFVVHIFGVEQRASYDIERLRKTAHSMSVEELKESLMHKTVAARKSAQKPTEAPAVKKTAVKKVVKKSAAKPVAKKAVKPVAKKSAKKIVKKVAAKSSFGKKTVPAKKMVKKPVKTLTKKAAPVKKAIAKKAPAKKSQAKKLPTKKLISVKKAAPTRKAVKKSAPKPAARKTVKPAAKKKTKKK